MTLVIQRIPIGPLVKICFVLYFIFAFLGVLLYSTVAMSLIHLVGSLAGGMNIPLEFPTGFSLIFFGFFGAITLAVVYTIITVIAALLYNVAAGMIGGIEAEVEVTELETLRSQVDTLRMEVAQLAAPPAEQ